MSFVPLRDLTARVLMRSALQNFLQKMAGVLAMNLAEVRKLAHSLLEEHADSDAADEDGAS